MSMRYNISTYFVILISWMMTLQQIVSSDLKHGLITYCHSVKKAKKYKRACQKNININQIDHESKTPLHHAIEQGDLSFANILAHKSANMHLVDKFGKKPLDYAKAPKTFADKLLLKELQAHARKQLKNQSR
jgi:aminopeptidase-like protein